MLLYTENLTKKYGRQEAEIIALDHVENLCQKGRVFVHNGGIRQWKINAS